MKNVKWTDNTCTVGGTCIHGYFTKADLEWLFNLCPSAIFTPTFCHEKLAPHGFSRNDLAVLDSLYWADWANDQKSIGLKELGYYFTFMEKDGGRLIAALSAVFPMVRGERCW